MITVYHAKKFADNESGYRAVAKVNTDDYKEAFALTQNVDGSWAQGPQLRYADEVEDNPDYSDDVEVLVELLTDEWGEEYGWRSTSSGDVLSDGKNYWFLVPAGKRGKYHATYGYTVKINNFDIDGFVYDELADI
jgi:hypothetical protein